MTKETDTAAYRARAWPLCLFDEIETGALSRAARFGDGLFETMRVAGGRPRFWPAHFARLSQGLNVLGLQLPAGLMRESLEDVIITLCAKSPAWPDARVRLTVWRAGGGLYAPEVDESRLLLEAWPTPPLSDELPAPASLCVYPAPLAWPSPWAGFKSLNGLPWVLAARYAQAQGCDWGAVTSLVDGSLCDAAGANIFVWNGETLITPSLSTGALPGVVRGAMLDAAPGHGVSVMEAPILPETLEQARAVFVTNAVAGLRPVQAVKWGGRRFELEKDARLLAQLTRALPRA